MPLLQVGDDTFLCESTIVSEYIAELYASTARLLPSDLEDRARMRLFAELLGSTFSFYPFLRGGDEFDDHLQKLKRGLADADVFLKTSSPDGPFVLGEQFTLAECTLAPFVQRMCVLLPHFTGTDGVQPKVDPLQICDDLGLMRVKQWMEAVRDRPSVVATGVPTEQLIKNTSRMLERFKK